MSDSGLDRIIRLNMIVLMWAFIVGGALFLLAPDSVVAFTNRLGSRLGDFSEAPATGFRLWLSLGVAYMVLISILAYLIQRDLHRNRALLLVLTAGKAASSATGLLFYLFHADAFAYLLTFGVDGLIVVNCLLLYRLLDPDSILRTGTRSFEKDGKPRAILRAVLATLVTDAIRDEAGGMASSVSLDQKLVAYLRELGPRAPLALMAALYAIEYGTLLWFRTLRPFTRLVPREREEYLRGFEESRFYLRQRLLFPLRMLATTLCYSEPEQEAATGYEFPTIDRSDVGVF
jgi:hypothetical protein